MPIAASWGAVHARLSRGSERTRGVYVGLRALSRRGELARRRDAARRLPAPAAPEIPDAQGFLVLPPWPFPGVEPVVRAARALRGETDLAPLYEHSEGRNLLRVPLRRRIGDDPAWLALATDETLLSSVTRYLGAAPLLTEAQLWISPFATHAPDGRALEHRYHCDWADVRQVRVLTFVEDLTPDHGPLTCVPAARSAAVRGSRRYTFGEAECTILDDDLFAVVGREEPVGLCGPAGTVAFADTCRTFHQGSRLRREGLERVMVMFQYLNVTAFKLSSEFVRRSPFARHATASHTPLQRMVLGAR